MSFSAFVDQYAPPKVTGFPFESSPRWSTDITTVKSGSSKRNSNWSAPLHRFTAPQAIRSQEDFEPIKDMWMVLNGPAKTFPFRDPLDFASVPLDFSDTEPPISSSDQMIGTTDGFASTFQLSKLYSFGPDSFSRPIALPVLSTVLISLNGHSPSSGADGGPYTVAISRPGGVVTFDPVPVGGLSVSAGFYFDVQVRFEADDTFDGIVQSWKLAGFANLTFVEERAC